MPLTQHVDLYSGNLQYNLLEASYLSDWSGNTIDYSSVDTEIDVEYFKNNSIKAVVKSSDETFINFSQNFFPVWKAYINGNEVQIYKVNDIIQGVFVPGGESVIEFRFTSPSLLLGGCITALTIGIIAFILFRHSKNQKQLLLHVRSAAD